MTEQTGDRAGLRVNLRRMAVDRREAMTATARVASTRRLERHLTALLADLSPDCLAFCWPFRGEPDLCHWMARWLQAQPGRTAALPVVTGVAQPLIFREWTPHTRLLPDRHGIPHPPDGPVLQPDVVLVPLNAFDANGYRIGYGGGYFDRTLAATSIIAVGVGFELGRVDSAFPQAHDKPMQWIVTEAGVWRTPESCAD